MAKVKVVESLIVSVGVAVSVSDKVVVKLNSGPSVTVPMVVVSEIVFIGMMMVPVFGMIMLLMATLVVVVVVVEKNI